MILLVHATGNEVALFYLPGWENIEGERNRYMGKGGIKSILFIL